MRNNLEAERMANSVYEQLNGKRTQNNTSDLRSQFQLFRQNPLQFLAQRNCNIPSELQNDPQSAVNYLIQSGQMNPGALQKVMGTLQRMGFRF